MRIPGYIHLKSKVPHLASVAWLLTMMVLLFYAVATLKQQNHTLYFSDLLHHLQDVEGDEENYC